MSQDEAKLKEQHPWLYFLHREHGRTNGGYAKRGVPLIALVGSVVALYQIVFISWPVQRDPTLWTDTQNAWFFTLSRVGWALSYMVIYFFIVFDQIPKFQPIL